MKWYDKHNAVGFGGSIYAESRSIAHVLGDKFMLVIWFFSYLLIIMIVAFSLSLELGLFSSIPLPLHLYSTYLLIKSLRASASAKQERYRVAGGIAEESIKWVKTVASCNAQGSLLRSLLWMYGLFLGSPGEYLRVILYLCG